MYVSKLSKTPKIEHPKYYSKLSNVKNQKRSIPSPFILFKGSTLHMLIVKFKRS